MIPTRVTLYTAGHLHTAGPHCWHSRAPIVHTAVPRENNENGCVYLRCRAVCKLPRCVGGHPWPMPSKNLNEPEITRDPFHEWFFNHNSNLMEISFCSHSSDRCENLHMAWQLCCLDLYKISQWHDTLQWSYTKINFPSNLNYDTWNKSNVHHIGPWEKVPLF